MRGPITGDLIAVLGKTAGFRLAPERCKLLAPQLDWLLGEAENLASLDLSGEEPIPIYQIGLFSSFVHADSPPETGQHKAQSSLP